MIIFKMFFVVVIWNDMFSLENIIRIFFFVEFLDDFSKFSIEIFFNNNRIYK